MLPPSPLTSQVQHHPQTTPARIPATSSFSNGRDLPAPSSSHRPLSSMSISSMLDSNPGKPPRETATKGHENGPSSAMPGFAASPTRQQGQPVSPPRLSQGSSLFSERSTSPEKYKVYQSQTGRPFRSYSGGLGQRPPSLGQQVSPEATRNGSLSGSQTAHHSPSSGLSLQRGWQPQEGRRLPDGRIVNRPSSQPSGHRSPPRDADGRAILGNSNRARHYQDARKRYIGLDQGGTLGQRKDGNGNPLDNERPQQRTYPTPEGSGMHLGEQLSPKQDRINGSSSSFLSRPTQGSDTDSHRTEAINPGLSRPFDQESQLSISTQSPFSPESLRRLQKERHVLHQQNTAHSPSKYVRAATVADERQPSAISEISAPFPYSMEMPKEKDAIDLRHFREDTNSNRKSSLAMLMENDRRGGRFSPLPQAVQGVQGRTSGPASDPGIKNEFARMFSGIGSGVGSAGPTGSGTSTPFAPPSPTMSHEQRPTPLSNHTELRLSKPMISSRGGKRSRKARDDESKTEPLDGDAGMLGATIAKAAKRSRQSHHHHPHLVHQ